MNASEYVSAVRHRLGLQDDDPILLDAQILEDLNYALKAIATKRDWPWLYSENTGDAAYNTNYPLPANHSRTDFITVDGTELVAASIGDLARFRSQFGCPRYFAVAGDYYNFAPSVGQGVTYPVVIGYYSNETELIADLDAPLLPDAYSEWLILETAVRSSSRSNRTDRVGAWREEAARWEKDAMKAVDRSVASPRIRRTRPSMWQDVR